MNVEAQGSALRVRPNHNLHRQGGRAIFRAPTVQQSCDIGMLRARNNLTMVFGREPWEWTPFQLPSASHSARNTKRRTRFIFGGVLSHNGQEGMIVSGKTDMSNNLIAVHKTGGIVIKRVLEWEPRADDGFPTASLPHVLKIKEETSAQTAEIKMSQAKAIFFVKNFEADLSPDEVKFFGDVPVTDLWVRVHFADGEVLEGQTNNDVRLLVDSGLWLKPFDSTVNNVLIYVPKSSVVEFHVMGVVGHRPEPTMEETAREI